MLEENWASLFGRSGLTVLFEARAGAHAVWLLSSEGVAYDYERIDANASYGHTWNEAHVAGDGGIAVGISGNSQVHVSAVEAQSSKARGKLVLAAGQMTCGC